MSLIAFSIVSLCCIAVLLCYIWKLKKEIRRIKKWVDQNEYIYFIDTSDNDINALARSINARIEQEEKKEKQLRKQDQTFKKMVTDLSHDLRTPLTVILGYLQLTRLEKEIHDPILTYLVHMEQKVSYLKRLVDDLYFLFWSEAIDQEIKLVPINLSALTASLLKEYLQNSRLAAEQLDIHLPHDTVFVNGDEKIITRILCNVIDNACKYSTGEIGFFLEVKADSCCIVVRNPSADMTVEELHSIFDLFYTKDQARTASNGIGLYTVKKLTEQLDGQVGATYENGLFQITLTLPLLSM